MRKPEPSRVTSTREVIVWLAASVICTSCARAEPFETFRPFLTDRPPKIVRTISTEVVDGVEVTELEFLSRAVPEKSRDVIIYGVLARPVGDGKKPAVLVTHGGGGSAVQVTPQVIGWAKRGYVSFGSDLPGICGKDRRSSGPCFDPGKGQFGIQESPTDSALYDGVVAALNGLALLRSQPDVDRARVGVTGGSWGGYMCTMVSGLAGRRVAASFSVYGCGYFDVGSDWTARLMKMREQQRELWLDNLDAGRVARYLTSAHFVASPANDWYFWPPAVMRTLADLPGHHNYCFMPNDSHALREPGGTSGPPSFDHRANRTYMEIVWLDYYLKGEGEPFPRAFEPVIKGREGNAVRVEFRVDGALPITASRVCYAPGEMPWRLKWWSSAPATPSGDGRYTAVIPIDEPDQPVHWFGVVSDAGSRSVSTLIETLDPSDLGFEVEGYPIARFVQDFEAPVERRPRWHRKYAERRPGHLRVRPEAAHSGKYGLELDGEATFACWGVRAASLVRAGATKLRVWMRAADEPCPPPAIDLLAELPDGRRYTWAWPSAPADPIDSTWRAIEIPLAELRPTGQETPLVPLLSPALGQLRFETKPETHVYIDDMEAL